MQLKKILFSVLVAIMMFSLVALAVSADATTTTLDLVADTDSAIRSEGNVAIKPGTSFSYTLSIANNPGVYGLQVYIGYNPEVVEFVEYKNYYADGTVFDTDSSLFDVYGEVLGEVKVAAMQPSDENGALVNNYKQGTLVTLVFKVKADFDGDFNDLVIKSTTAFNKDFDRVKVNSQNVGVIKAHNYGDAKIDAPTCTAGGKITYTCSKCNDVWTFDDLANPATGHTPSAEWTVTVPATCTTTGTEVKNCTVCGEAVPGEVQEIPANGHSFGDWSVKTAPTQDAKGEEIRSCANCTETETRDIEKLPKFTSIPSDPWKLGSEEAGLTFVTDAASDKFVKVSVNGTELSSNCYTVTDSNGSTKVVLKAEYLDSLEEGTYELTVTSQNGSCTAEFAIEAASNAAAIIVAIIIVIVVIGAVVAVVIVLKKKGLIG